MYSIFQPVVVNRWHFVAVTFSFGNYEYEVFQEGADFAGGGGAFTHNMPVNSHSSATIGFVDNGLPTFTGYMDDVSELHCILHYITLHYITLHNITLYYITYYIALYYIALYYIVSQAAFLNFLTSSVEIDFIIHCIVDDINYHLSSCK